MTDEREDEQARGAEHPGLVLNGEEEHPLSPRFLGLDLEYCTEDRTLDEALEWPEGNKQGGRA